MTDRAAAGVTAMLVAATLAGCAGPGQPSTSRPAPFAADGCSCFPDGTWGHHCVEHDLAYWRGGTAQQRLQADRLLRQRLADDGRPLVGNLMFLGVRFGGTPWLPTPWRWGFGWPYPRGYRELSAAEQGAAQAMLAAESDGPASLPPPSPAPTK